MSTLILARVILPSYSLFTPFPSRHLTPLAIRLRGAETFRATEQAAQQIGLTHDQYTRPAECSSGSCCTPVVTRTSWSPMFSGVPGVDVHPD